MPVRTHDLLRIDSDAAARDWPAAPAWVAPALHGTPWVVVRRDRISSGIAIGVRGTSRSDRHPATIETAMVREVRSPESLAAAASAGDTRFARAFAACSREALKLGMNVLPVGAYGFQIASGVEVTHPASDLDMIIRARDGATFAALRAFARSCVPVSNSCGIAFDIEVEIDDCSFALAELIDARGTLVAKTPHGPCRVLCQA